MELKDIIAISGQPGLYKYVARSARGVIVESLADGKRSNAANASRMMSALTDISIFTEAEDRPLAEVFTAIYEREGGRQTISHKESPETLKAWFAKAVPDYDRERVHVSDIKKVVMWYNILVGAGMTEFRLPDEEPETAEQA